MQSDIDKIQVLFNALPVTPMLSAVNEKSSQIILSQMFLKEAEKLRPWTAIGFDDWLGAGRWWLLKAQTQLYAETAAKTIPAQAYADLLKASFIIVDIFPKHPSRRLWNSEYLQVELLAEELKRELTRSETLGLRKPDSTAVQNTDLRIWADIAPEIDLIPAPYIESNSYSPGTWQTQDEHILWRGFAHLIRPGQDYVEDCIVFILVRKDGQNARIICHNQKGVSLYSKSLIYPTPSLIIAGFIGDMLISFFEASIDQLMACLPQIEECAFD